MDIQRVCNEISQYQQGSKKFARLKNRYNLPPEQYYLLYNLVKAFVEYNNYVKFPHQYFVSQTSPSQDKVKDCLCNVENYRKVGEGWWAEAFVIEDPDYEPTRTCNPSKRPSKKSSKSSRRNDYKYLVKVEHLTRHNVTAFGNLKELTTILTQRYETLEIAKKAGSIGVGPKVFDGYECVQGKQVYFITVMEYLDGETYVQFYKKHKDNKELIQQIVKEIHAKTEKLNNNRILHKDVHGDNIIVVQKGDKYVPVLIDFGNAVYAVDKNLPTIEDPKDINHGIDKDIDLINKLVFKFLDDNIIKIK